jgi:hypothetical protein
MIAMQQEKAGLKKGLKKSREERFRGHDRWGLIRGRCNRKCIKIKVKTVLGEPE